MARGRVIRRFRRVIAKVATGVVFLAIVVLLLMWLAGTFHEKIGDMGAVTRLRSTAGHPIGDTQLAAVRTILLPRIESSVGTIRAVHETAVASKLLAKVVEVPVVAGQRVKSGEVLVRLDDEDLLARLEQAEAVADGARAARDQAGIEHDRVRRLMEQQAAARIEWDRAQTALEAAEAELARAQKTVSEARTVLGYAAILSPITGVVVDKKVDVGDTVTPGQILVALYDPTRMQLVASVRESLTRRLAVGQTVDVHLDALDKRCQGRVSEIVPEAESASRTFSVKVTGPCPPGIYSGMFGRLLIPFEHEEVLVVPRPALRRIGQLDIVEVADGSLLRRRAVQSGRTFGEDVEVLSGLREGEHVALPDWQAGSPASEKPNVNGR